MLTAYLIGFAAGAASAIMFAIGVNLIFACWLRN